ncbi:MAG TPA: hypothetical protein VGY54_13750 [Polyangiaceae bacterium]|nr:hypothetical protein [Polyangiaceae bacterium]
MLLNPELLPLPPPDGTLAPLDPLDAVWLLPAQPNAAARTATGSVPRWLMAHFASKENAGRNSAEVELDHGSTCAKSGGRIMQCFSHLPVLPTFGILTMVDLYERACCDGMGDSHEVHGA